MFGRWHFHHHRPAFAWGGGYQPGPGESWQPWAGPEHPPFGPHWGHHGPWHPPFGRGFWWMARHFPFGPGRGFPFGPGRGPAGERFMGRGDLKYALLGLLRERPMHGYEMIKQLEEQASGFYTPSAGAVYPTLQLMEDRGWVTSQVVDGKKVYTITDAGRQELEAHEQRSQAEEYRRGPFGWGGPHRWRPGGPFGRQALPDLAALRHDSMEVTRLVWAAVIASGGDPEKLARLRAIIAGTRKNLEEFLGQAPSAPTGGASEPTGGTVEDA